MECRNHPGVEPIARCVICGAHLCEGCAVDHGGRMYCFNCVPSPEVPRADLVEPLVPGLELARAFSYVLDDPEWLKKMAIGVVFMAGSFLVIPFLVVLGYMVETVRKVAEGDDLRLPGWDNLRHKLELGAKLLALELIYAIPFLLVLSGTILIGVFAGGGDVQIRGLQSLSEWFALVGFVVGWILVVITGLLWQLMNPAFTGRLALSGSLRKSLRIGVIVSSVQSSIRLYLMVLLITVLACGFLLTLGLLACCIGVFLTSFYCLMVNAHLYGQVARYCQLRE